MRRALAVLSLLLLPRAALAADVKSECIAASDAGQDQRDHGKLLAARQSFVSCARDACPSMVRSECAGWLRDVERRMPTMVLAARDSAGRDVIEVSVTLDGNPLTERLDGRQLPVDPGEHFLVFTTREGARAEQRIMVRDGDKGRAVDAVFPPPEPRPLRPPPVTPTSRPVPAVAYVLGGAGVLGVASFALFAGLAKHDADDLRSTCAPTCPSSRVDPARRELAIGNVSLAVGLAALAGATVIVLTRPDVPESAWLSVDALSAGAGARAGVSF